LHDVGDGFKAALHDQGPISEGFELGSGRRHGCGITVDPEKAEVRSSGEEWAGMPAASDRRINDGSRRDWGEKLDHLPDHDRSVLVATHVDLLADPLACLQPPGRTTSVRISPRSGPVERAE
jgi:hypothetical protein